MSLICKVKKKKHSIIIVILHAPIPKISLCISESDNTDEEVMKDRPELIDS